MELSEGGLRDYQEKITMMFKRLQFTKKAQLDFLEDLYALVSDGIPANRAIEMLGTISKGVKQDVANALSKKIAEGQPLADGMQEWFDMNVVEIIRVGESGGALAQTLKSAVNMLSQQGATMGVVIGAVAYPIFVILMASSLIVYLDGQVLKEFRAIKPFEAWPDAGKRLVYTAHAIKEYWWLFILFLIAAAMALKRIMSHYVGELRPALDKIPPFTLYRRLVAARFLETLGLLVSNGVIFKSSIRIMQMQATPYLGMHLAMMEHLLSMGKTNIADVLATGLIDENDLMRLRIMAEVKGFEHGLVRMGVKGAEAATKTMGVIAKALGGVFMVIGGYMIITIIQGIFTTGMSLTS